MYYFPIWYLQQRKNFFTLNYEKFHGVRVNPEGLKNCIRIEANLFNHGKSFEYLQITQFKGKIGLFIIFTRGSAIYFI